MNEYIIKLSIVAIISMHPVGDDIKQLEDKPVDEGKSTEILRGGTISDSNISITIKDGIIEIKIKEIAHLPITMILTRDGKEIESKSSTNEDEIIFEIDIKTLKAKDSIKIKNRFEDISKIMVKD